MERIPEPELMDDFEQARAYALADFEEPHTQFIELFRQHFPEEVVNGVVLDIGCGTGDITKRFAYAYPACRIHAVDGAEQMLMFARQTVDFEMLHERVRLFQRTLPTDSLAKEKYDVLICNSLLHHLAEPQVLWDTVKQFAKEGAAVFVMDLMRCESTKQAAAMVREYAANEPEVLQRDFYNSLLAAFTPAEVEAQLAEAGLSHLTVEVVSDRHLIVSGRC
ncbi:MAG: methyltransferase domain-containing protein [Gammaproteobacteria bacterium]|nr:methyltransferase domain-containing protein [Gammaproteobacteria bacterium]MCW8992567.1 methyltransferase domain-containing protein [Gammaproteobacteria bacterium]